MHIFVGWSKLIIQPEGHFVPEFISAGKISGSGVGGHQANDGGCSVAIMVLVRRDSREQARMWSEAHQITNGV